MWQCASMRPGKMNLPVASMTVSSGVSGHIEPSVSPTRVIRFPSTTRSLFGTGSPPDPSINVPFLISSRMALAIATASLKVGKTEHAIRRYGSPAKSGVEGLQRAGRPHRDGPGSERNRGDLELELRSPRDESGGNSTSIEGVEVVRALLEID